MFMDILWLASGIVNLVSTLPADLLKFHLKDAIIVGNVGKVEYILTTLKADPNARYRESTDCNTSLSNATAVIWTTACHGLNSSLVVEVLLKSGADANARDSNGFSALMYAAMSGDANSARLLLDHGANVEEQCNCGFTSLMWAARRGHVAMVNLLIKRGADVNYKDEKGNSALGFAESFAFEEIKRILVNAGAVF